MRLGTVCLIGALGSFCSAASIFSCCYDADAVCSDEVPLDLKDTPVTEESLNKFKAIEGLIYCPTKTNHPKKIAWNRLPANINVIQWGCENFNGFNPGRLNIVLDDKNMVCHVYIG